MPEYTADLYHDQEQRPCARMLWTRVVDARSETNTRSAGRDKHSQLPTRHIDACQNCPLKLRVGCGRCGHGCTISVHLLGLTRCRNYLPVYQHAPAGYGNFWIAANLRSLLPCPPETHAKGVRQCELTVAGHHPFSAERDSSRSRDVNISCISLRGLLE